MRQNAVVRRTGRTWGVFVGGQLVEGGFFAREAAEACAAWRTGERDPLDDATEDGRDIERAETA